MILTGADFAEIGSLAYGRSWRAPLAKRLKKTERTVRRYENEDTRIPRKVRLELLIIVTERRDALTKWAEQL